MFRRPPVGKACNPICEAPIGHLVRAPCGEVDLRGTFTRTAKHRARKLEGA